LQRVNDTQFGNDPVNWTSASPTPGPQASNLDTDHDGIPDSWEILYGFDPLNPLDAGLDSDGDGLTNLEEYGMGTDPRNAASGVSITSISPVTPGVTARLVFTAAANKAYAIQFASSVTGPWQTVQTVNEAGTTRLIQLVVPASGFTGFSRLALAQMSSLRIDSITTGGGQVQLNLAAPANAGCALQFRSSLSEGSWTTLNTYPAAPTNRVLQFSAPLNLSSPSGFYRMQLQ